MPSNNTTQRFGSHLSVAGGLHLAFDTAVAVGCDCLAIFVKNQRQWKAPPLTQECIRLFRDAQVRTGIQPVIAHASYLLNLASPTSSGREQSIRALIDELQRCEALGVPSLVIHPGAHMGEGDDAGIARIAASLDEVHRATTGITAQVLLESTAGQGTAIGHEISHLGRILESVKTPDRLGICIDTCHLFAAGYDLRRKEKYDATIDELAKCVGLHRIKCIHTNDSKTPCGSRVDRHENIGKGKMGNAAFVNLVNDPRLATVPRILETPKGVDGRGTDLDRVNLKRLRGLIQKT
ncbi:MAG: deoxyribonuclease IV [Planctomycetota bacterium]